MPDLEPITRKETLLDGGDLTPITRKEMFIKRIYDKTQSVPEPITREEYFLAKAGEGSGGDVTIEQLNVTENGTYSESGKAYSPVVVNVPTPPIPENAYLLNNLSGLPADIASFNDGTDLPMASLKVAVTPYQDLHGYDAPWAGGAGKNKFDQDTVYASYKQSDGSFIGWVSSITAIKRYFTAEEVGKTYTASVYVKINENASNVRIQGHIGERNPDGTIVNSSSYERSTLTVTPISTDDYIIITYGTTGIIQFKDFQLEENNQATSYAPYANICLISGWDEAVVTVADDVENPTTSHEYTIDLDGTRYGGVLDATNGVMDDTLDHIASYNGEALPSTWISDRDVYAEGTTPTIGAEVVYTRATPITVQLAPTPVKSLVGTNNIFADCGDIIELEYFSKEV